MNDLFFARAQMGLSLAFHIVFASAGIAMPVLMVAADVLHGLTKDATYLELSKLWAKGTAVLFAVGAVSGTVLSFELGLLFPGFMRHAGALVGLPFSLEGYAFFTEAIFLGLYLYGRDRLPRWGHLASGVVVAASGLASAVFVTIVNAWMNAPRGFVLEDGQLTSIDPIEAMKTPFALHEVVHMAVAAYLATAFGAAALHAFGLLRDPTSALHRRALGIALWVGAPAALVQPLVGHFAGQRVAELQPLKLAAIEGLEHTQAMAPLTIGPLRIPGALSLLAFDDPSAVVTGLSAFPREDWPSGAVRICFQLMVGIGTLLAGLAVWALARRIRRRPPESSRAFLWALVAAGPFGFVATEAGWMVTELGRQPWTIYGVLRTRDAATPMPGLWLPFLTFSVVYLALAWITAAIILGQLRGTARPAGKAPPESGEAGR